MDRGVHWTHHKLLDLLQTSVETLVWGGGAGWWQALGQDTTRWIPPRRAAVSSISRRARVDQNSMTLGRSASTLLADGDHRAHDGHGGGEGVEGWQRRAKETHPRSVLLDPCQVESGVREKGRAQVESGVKYPHTLVNAQRRGAWLSTTPDDGSGKSHAEQTRRQRETSDPEANGSTDVRLSTIGAAATATHHDICPVSGGNVVSKHHEALSDSGTKTRVIQNSFIVPNTRPRPDVFPASSMYTLCMCCRQLQPKLCCRRPGLGRFSGSRGSDLEFGRERAAVEGLFRGRRALAPASRHAIGQASRVELGRRNNLDRSGRLREGSVSNGR